MSEKRSSFGVTTLIWRSAESLKRIFVFSEISDGFNESELPVISEIFLGSVWQEKMSAAKRNAALNLKFLFKAVVINP